MIQRKFVLTATVLLLTVAGAAIVFQKAVAQQKDEIEYNSVYDCGSGRLKFKVLSCKGTGKFDRCEVFYINEHSPNGGFKDSNSRGLIIDTINQGCKTKSQPKAKNEQGAGEQRESATPNSKNDPTPARADTGGVACSASSPDADGKSANEKTFRGVIRRLWEKEAREGSDGAVTITFQKVVVGAPRAWRPTATDAYSQADPRKPIYPVRATFATCTDYRAAISKRKMERIYDCFVHKTGGWQCTQTGASGPLAIKDEKEYIQKPRQQN
ncbi:MAG TPA: hypothetical protein VEW46_22520 [Pyrinomonadaceae bacterium]|nr:hypothetical protein [Pyrinomonadaceae bacterium]